MKTSILVIGLVTPTLISCSDGMTDSNFVNEGPTGVTEEPICTLLPPPTTCNSPLWPNGRIPYAYDSSTSGWGSESTPGTAKANIRAAMNQWQNGTGNRITFVLAPTDSERVIIRAGTGCSSGLPGKTTSGVHYVDWLQNCPFAHELGHVIGLYHEHQRADRNKYVVVNTAAPICSDYDEYKQCINSNGGGSDYGPYDLSSTEQYNSAGSPPDLTRRSDGAQITTGMGAPDSHDLSAALELYAGAYSWGKFWTLERDLGSTVPWDPTISGTLLIAGAPTNTDRQAAGSLNIFARATDNTIWGKEAQGSVWSEWYGLGLPGGFAAQGDPAAAVIAGTTGIEVAAQANNLVWLRYWNASWGPWGQIGAPSPGLCAGSNLALSTWGGNRLDVFAKACDGKVWYKSWTGSAWIDWRLIATSFSSGKPAAVSWGSGRIDLFIVDSTHTLFHEACASVTNCDSNTWSGWESLGGVAATGSSPSAASSNSGWLDAFVLGTDNRVWTRTWRGSGWTAFAPLGGNVTGGSVAVTSPTAGHIDLNAKLTDNGLWHRWTL
jgi:hypothetical protein